MDLRSHYPYWLLKHGIVKTYPSVTESLHADIAIIGSGITGALVAYQLCKEGFYVVMVDKRHVGQGSTAASTCLLQYEIDTPLHKLISKVGERNAVRSYELCLEAIEQIGKIAHNFKHVEFIHRPSFQFASFKHHVADLQKEYILRKQYGISSVEWLTGADVKDKFGFEAPAGILSADGAQLDAYRMAHSLIYSASRNGLRVYDSTPVTAIRHHKRSIELKLEGKYTITARKLIICCGYESQAFIPKKIETLNSTYATISEPYEQTNFWYKNSLIWETANPYIYLRTTSDNRILIGGMDDTFYNPDKRDRKLKQKAVQLRQSFQKLFPHLDFKSDFEWAGTFCGTKDGLPYIGSIPQRPHTYFALGFGGNGITFGQIAACCIRDILVNKKNPDTAIFSFTR
ncbi:MAG TPA: FAD-dependent oxidoreductase [Ohtaekwangia sp.]|uniref:NAD(P)/FAD-dependent oxidoreductase n=1 Tax=Ohtaekwangia sp. TaxID=2066019 RepID=UPI002F948B50